ncbi:hypothetical protein HanOQP8_Chr01g0014441 [Helianthus annuus]|nr:hypothetical protein HanOQP8_Chr01g0014441 [Helianthus annuus]
MGQRSVNLMLFFLPIGNFWWICEICGATAQNVGGDQTHEMSHTITETEPVDRSATGPVMVPAEPRTFWQGRKIMNILLGCMVFAFIISWLFHFNVLP